MIEHEGNEYIVIEATKEELPNHCEEINKAMRDGYILRNVCFRESFVFVYLKRNRKEQAYKLEFKAPNTIFEWLKENGFEKVNEHIENLNHETTYGYGDMEVTVRTRIKPV